MQSTTQPMLTEVAKEEWIQKRNEAIRWARKLAVDGEDVAYYYTAHQMSEFRCLLANAKVKYPRGHRKWTIRHFSPVNCSDTYTFARTQVTCFLRSPDGKHYISKHLPGFCPIHTLMAGRQE